MRQLAWLLIIAGLGIYLYENQTGNYVLPSVEQSLPKSINLDIIALAGGIGILAFG